MNNKVLFSCDAIYFQKYGMYNVLSCNNTENAVHAHIINPDQTCKELVDDLKSYCNIDFTFSYEYKNFSNYNQYQIKSYYYMRRFYIAKDELKNLNCVLITDADVIFNKKINFNLKLGLQYIPKNEGLWRKTSAAVVFVHRDYINFLEKVLNEYEKQIKNIDYSVLDTNVDKLTKGNLVGLDQVCLTKVIESDYVDDKNFINLYQNRKIISKRQNEADIWILVGNKHTIDFKSMFLDYYNDRL